MRVSAASPAQGVAHPGLMSAVAELAKLPGDAFETVKPRGEAESLCAWPSFQSLKVLAEPRSLSLSLDQSTESPVVYILAGHCLSSWKIIWLSPWARLLPCRGVVLR